MNELNENIDIDKCAITALKLACRIDSFFSSNNHYLDKPSLQIATKCFIDFLANEKNINFNETVEILNLSINDFEAKFRSDRYNTFITSKNMESETEKIIERAESLIAILIEAKNIPTITKNKVKP